MRRIISLTLLFSLFVMVPGVFAEEKKWSNQAELSYVDTAGNTEVTSLSAKNLLKYKFTEKLQGSWKLGALFGKSDGEKKAESYLIDPRLDYLVTDRFYLAAIAGWLQDKFAGIDSRYYLGPSMGYKFLIGPKHFLGSEAGLNYVNEEYTNGTEKDYLGGRAFGKYVYSFTETNKLSQSLEFLIDFDDSDNYNVNSETALVSALSSSLSLKTSYVIKHDNQPIPSSLDKTDTVLSLTLLINF